MPNMTKEKKQPYVIETVKRGRTMTLMKLYTASAARHAMKAVAQANKGSEVRIRHGEILVDFMIMPKEEAEDE